MQCVLGLDSGEAVLNLRHDSFRPYSSARMLSLATSIAGSATLGALERPSRCRPYRLQSDGGHHWVVFVGCPHDPLIRHRRHLGRALARITSQRYFDER